VNSSGLHYADTQKKSAGSAATGSFGTTKGIAGIIKGKKAV